jgi:hypothetical protein
MAKITMEHLMSLQLRTLRRHEHTHPHPEKERGSKYWRAVEVLSSTWFVVESQNEIGIRRWMTASITEAAHIQRSLEPSRWSRIFICLYSPFSISQGTLFEEILEVHLVSADGPYVFKLANGLTFAGDVGSNQKPSMAPEEISVLYCSKRTPY